MKLLWTLCFIRTKTHVLMLNRFKAPNMGLWNGVGGRIETGETPLQCVKREAMEETGWEIQPRFGGIVTWQGVSGPDIEGMYVYTADVNQDEAETEVAVRGDEGILAFLPIEWVKHHNNRGVVDNIHYFIHAMLSGATPMRWHCAYTGGWLTDVNPRPLPLTIDLEGVVA